MHDTELLVIWFSLVMGGALFTMLMPQLVWDSRGNKATQDTRKRKGSMVLIGNETQIRASLSRYLQRNVSYLVFIDYCVKESDEAGGSQSLGVSRP